jgi:hypothetical protein
MGSYLCEGCGNYVTLDHEMLDCGSTFKCACGATTVIGLFTPEDYVKAVAAISGVAIQQITAPDRLPHLRSGGE